MANTTTTTLSQANCRKVFVQRDFSEGTGVRFSTRFPAELEGKIDRQLYDYTINTLNSLYEEAEKGSCSTYCEVNCGKCGTYILHLRSRGMYT